MIVSEEFLLVLGNEGPSMNVLEVLRMAFVECG